MDLMSRTDLFDRLEERGTFSEPEAAGMVYNLLVAVRFISVMPRQTIGGGGYRDRGDTDKDIS